MEINSTSLQFLLKIDKIFANISSEILLSDLTIKCGAIFASSDYEADQCSNGDSINNSISLSYDENTLNDFYFPTEGKKTALTFKITTPISDFQYFSTDLTHKNYYPLNEDFTFNSVTKINIATGIGGKDLPFFKRYYGGGSSSVRGFDFNSLGAKYLNGTAKGGESAILQSFSIISPAKTFGIDQENIRLASFIDLGTINEKLSQLKIDDFRASTGVALSWLTPIGPIGFNASKPLIKKAGDNTESFTFELGTTF